FYRYRSKFILKNLAYIFRLAQVPSGVFQRLDAGIDRPFQLILLEQFGRPYLDRVTSVWRFYTLRVRRPET
ncbi:hypothetical protein P4U14_35800, partial [Bacillus paranthracis]|nr:hypothetical protein [Bacillus paranthracis]